jgi:hypothetical protein
MKTYKTAKGTELPIMNMRGKDYLEVKWRLVWFRETHPDWSIETDFVLFTEKDAFAKALIRNHEGRVMATSHKYEDKLGFGDYREKAETGAIGRALALLGFGTQFCADELDEGKRIVDSPVAGKGPGVHPEQPEASDGVYGTDYRIPFGKYSMKSLEEVGPDELRSYVLYLESRAKKDGKEIQGQVADFIDRASQYIGAFENQQVGQFPA